MPVQTPSLVIRDIDDTNNCCIEQDGMLFLQFKSGAKYTASDALRKVGCALCLIPPEKQNDMLCKIAVSNNGYALRYVSNKTPEICLYAIRKTPWAWQYVKEEFKEELLEEHKKSIIDYIAEKRIKRQGY